MTMGRKLDLSGLTDHEAEHVLQVVQRDMRLRKKEEARLSELKQELDEEGSRCLLLSRQSCFNQRCCIRCCAPFTFLLNPKRRCQDCGYNVCKACRVYCKRDKAWLCSACQRSRLLKTRSQEWFYTNVKRRFKRFGSAKVLKTLYRKHLAEHSALSRLTEGSAYEESVCNEGSVCGSDSTFYRQTEEHSMAETLGVALRVAEEAIDEAISKAETDTLCQEKQDEASYLREHRTELIEELAKTIVQKIVSRRKTLAEMRADYERSADLHPPDGSVSDDASCAAKLHSNLWRSHSAFSLLDGSSPVLLHDSPHTTRESGGVSAMAGWRSVDRLDNAVLTSPDGNWIALQSAQLSRPGRVAKRKSLVYSALEKESGVVSAYEGLGSDSESKPEPDGSWGAVLQEIHKKMTDNRGAPAAAAGRGGSRDGPASDGDASWKPGKPLAGLFKWKVPAEIRKPSSSRRTSVIDLNFNLEGASGDQEEEEEEVEEEEEEEVPAASERVRRTRKKKRSRKEVAVSSSSSPILSSDAMTPDTLTCGAATPKLLDSDDEVPGDRVNHVDGELASRPRQPEGRASDAFAGGGLGDGGGERRDGRSTDGDEDDETSWRMEVDAEGGRAEDGEDEEIDEEMRYRLYRLVNQSRLAYFSSTEDELDRAGRSEGEWDRDGDEDMDGEDGERGRGEPGGFSSAEDEPDGVYVERESPRGDEDVEDVKKDVELAVKVCRLVHQVNATEFSSTEDELDRAGRDGEDEELIDAESLWKLQAEKAVRAAQLRDLASLVSASQFSSTEDELDRIAGSEDGAEGGGELSESGGEAEEPWGPAAVAAERRESIGEIDVKMFDLREEIERSEAGSPEGRTAGGVLLDEDAAHEQSEFEVDEAESGQTTGDVYSHQEDTKQDKVEGESEQTTKPSCETEAQSEEQPGRSPEGPGAKEGGEKPPRAGKRSSANSDEEEAEFDRIISSMLLMTLEDMRPEGTPGGGGERRGRDGEQGGASEKDGSAEGADEESRTGAAGVAEGRPESTDGKREDGGDAVAGVCGRQDEVGGKADAQEGEKEDRQICETREAEPTGDEAPRAGGDTADEKEAQDDAAGREGQDVDKKPVDIMMEGLLSPQEIQDASDMEFYKTITFISTLLEQRYAAMSLCSVTTEVLKLLNATEGLLHGEGGAESRPTAASLPPDADPKKLDQQFSTLEENVYVAAGSVYSLEVELGDLEECARGIRSSTSHMELSFLEEQVAAAAAKVQQSDMQISDISARIAALKSAGLNVDPGTTRFAKSRNAPARPATLDSSRQLRRRLPTPPVKDHKEA